MSRPAVHGVETAPPEGEAPEQWYLLCTLGISGVREASPGADLSPAPRHYETAGQGDFQQSITAMTPTGPECAAWRAMKNTRVARRSCDWRCFLVEQRNILGAGDGVHPPVVARERDFQPVFGQIRA